MSERFACRVTGQHRSTQRRRRAAQTLADPDAALRDWLRTWARSHPRQGFRRAYHDARGECWTANHKKIQRLWREQGSSSFVSQRFLSSTLRCSSANHDSGWRHRAEGDVAVVLVQHQPLRPVPTRHDHSPWTFQAAGGRVARRGHPQPDPRTGRGGPKPESRRGPRVFRVVVPTIPPRRAGPRGTPIPGRAPRDRVDRSSTCPGSAEPGGAACSAGEDGERVAQ
jgi:hypothetical protein